MWAYDDDLGRGRRARDLPRSSAGPSRSAAYYYDDACERPTYSSSRYQQPDSQSQPSSSHRSHRRKSVPAADLGEPTKSSSSRHANVIASDDGSDFYRRTTRDPYAYLERTSRHDVEAKTGDRSRKFREKRGTYETDESQNLRRAKSHSPRRAARDVEASRNPSPPTTKSAWGDEAADAYGRTTSSKKSSSSRMPQQYYDTDPYATDYANYRDRNAGGYDYTSAGMPRPPMGAAPSVAPPEEKSSKHSRRSKNHHSSAEDDYAAATAAGYDPRGAAAAYAVDEKPSRHRSHHSSKPRDDPVDPYAAQSRRGRHRGVPPTSGGLEDYDDPYASRSAPPPRAKQRQSVPPRTRSRYDGLGEGAEVPAGDYGEDPHYNPAPSRRRAASVNHGGGYYGDRYGSDPGKGRRERPQQYYDDDRYDARGSPGAGGSPNGAPPGRSSSKKEKGKQWQKQAGKLFMTHAVPVIKKEAVPFLTKAAQAYFEQKR